MIDHIPFGTPGTITSENITSLVTGTKLQTITATPAGSIEVVNNSDNYCLLAFGRVGDNQTMFSSWSYPIPPFTGIIRPSPGGDITLYIAGAGNAQQSSSGIRVNPLPGEDRIDTWLLPQTQNIQGTITAIQGGSWTTQSVQSGTWSVGQVGTWNANVTIQNASIAVTQAGIWSINATIQNATIAVTQSGTWNANVTVQNATLNVTQSGTWNMNVTNSNLAVVNSGGTNIQVTNATGTTLKTIQNQALNAQYVCPVGTLQLVTPTGGIPPLAGATALTILSQSGGNMTVRVRGALSLATYYEATIGPSGFGIALLPNMSWENIEILVTNNGASSWIMTGWWTAPSLVIPINAGNQPLTVVPASGSQFTAVPGTSATTTQNSVYASSLTATVFGSSFTTKTVFGMSGTFIFGAGGYGVGALGVKGLTTNNVVWFIIGGGRDTNGPAINVNFSPAFGRSLATLLPGDASYQAVYAYSGNTGTIPAMFLEAETG